MKLRSGSTFYSTICSIDTEWPTPVHARHHLIHALTVADFMKQVDHLKALHKIPSADKRVHRLFVLIVAESLMACSKELKSELGPLVRYVYREIQTVKDVPTEFDLPRYLVKFCMQF